MVNQKCFFYVRNESVHSTSHVVLVISPSSYGEVIQANISFGFDLPNTISHFKWNQYFSETKKQMLSEGIHVLLGNLANLK
jgi:hypothetical protein